MTREKTYRSRSAGSCSSRSGGGRFRFRRRRRERYTPPPAQIDITYQSINQSTNQCSSFGRAVSSWAEHERVEEYVPAAVGDTLIVLKARIGAARSEAGRIARRALAVETRENKRCIIL